MATTNICVARREIPRAKNESKYIHGNSPGDRVYRQITRIGFIRKQNTPNYRISYFELSNAFISNILGCGHILSIRNTTLSIRASRQKIDTRFVPYVLYRDRSKMQAQSTRLIRHSFNRPRKGHAVLGAQGLDVELKG